MRGKKHTYIVLSVTHSRWLCIAHSSFFEALEKDVINRRPFSALNSSQQKLKLNSHMWAKKVLPQQKEYMKAASVFYFLSKSDFMCTQHKPWPQCLNTFRIEAYISITAGVSMPLHWCFLSLTKPALVTCKQCHIHIRIDSSVSIWISSFYSIRIQSSSIKRWTLQFHLVRCVLPAQRKGFIHSSSC